MMLKGPYSVLETELSPLSTRQLSKALYLLSGPMILSFSLSPPLPFTTVDAAIAEGCTHAWLVVLAHFLLRFSPWGAHHGCCSPCTFNHKSSLKLVHCSCCTAHLLTRFPLLGSHTVGLTRVTTVLIHTCFLVVVYPHIFSYVICQGPH